MNKLLPAALLSIACTAALAQYKVIRPDGSVTYTDRPPIDAANVRITPLGRVVQAVAAPAETGLPIELRQAAQRYPVILYTSADCAPCDSGRRLLQQRGVPFGERLVGTQEDVQALERLVGGRSVPALTIGAQQLRGFSDADWTAYLDAAGYPRESKLPRNWPAPAATPLVERTPAAPRTAGPVPATRNEEPQVPVLPSAGLRF